MKQWKLKALAAALAVAVVGPAHALIAESVSGNGELFFTIYDNVTQTSYTRDLGLTVDNFTTAAGGTTVNLPASFTVAADSTLTSFLGGFNLAQQGTLLWNIGAMDGVGSERYLTSALSMPGPSGSASVMTNSQLKQLDAADQFTNPTNALGTHPGTLATNGSNTASAAANGQAFGGSGVWGNNWGNKANFNTTQIGLGSSNNFWLLFQNGTLTTNRTFYASAGSFTLEGDGDLVFGAPAAVPVPAAVWLLGSGLVGLVGIARRREGAMPA